LQGFFWRTIAMLRVGIKPLYVFDGKPPELKSGELAKRNMRREEGATKLKEAEEMGDVEEMNKFSKRTLRVTRQHAQDCKRLLALMGVPTLDAPCEAEAQCAALCKAGLVYATATEDMDALCCGSPVLVRRLTFSEARKLPVLEYRLDKVLQGLNVTMAEFVDLCILCGCDFAGTIKGVGPKTALNGIRKHHTIELFLKSLNATKHPPPDPFPLDDVRQILMQPEVADPKNVSIDWSQPADEPGLISFLVKEKGFSEQRVRNGIEALNKARRTKPQGRLESFFKPAPKYAAPNTPTPPAGAGKRPGESAGAGAGAGGKGAGAEGGGGGAPAADMRTEAEKQSAAETGATGMKAAAETGDEGGEAHKPMGRKEEALEGRDGRKRGASAALDVDSPSNSSHHSRKRV
jgi:flap endonuclease-1